MTAPYSQSIHQICAEYTDQDLIEFSEGLLPSLRHKTILNHLAHCQACETELSRLIHHSQLILKPTPEPTTDPSEFEAFRARLQLPPEPDIQFDFGDSIGPFELVGKLGNGGSSTVYECIDTYMRRRVAIKVLNPRLFDSSSLSRLELEARTLAKLDHPGIVRAFEIKPYHYPPYIVMELAAGGSSANLIKKSPLAPALAARLVAGVARAVQHAHDQGILHRDIKPSNLLVDQPFDPNKPIPLDISLKVSDFGLARLMGSDSKMSSIHAIVGTPAYMSPEQSCGNQNEVGPASDIYSIGVVLYEFLIGRPPLVSDNTMLTLRMVNEVEPLSPRLIQSVIPRDLDTICMKCLLKDPLDRYATAEELAEDLERFLENRPILARPIDPFSKVLRWCRRNQALAASLFVCLTLLTSLFVLAITFAIFQKNLRQKVEASSTLYQQAAVEASLESDSFRTLMFSSIGNQFQFASELEKVQNHRDALLLSEKAKKLNRQSIASYMKRPSLQKEFSGEFVDVYFRDALALRDIGFLDESSTMLQRIIERAFQTKPGDKDYARMISVGNRTAPVIGKIKQAKNKPDEARSIMLRAWKAFPLPTDQTAPEPLHFLERYALLTTLLETLKDPDSKAIATLISDEIEFNRKRYNEVIVIK